MIKAFSEYSYVTSCFRQKIVKTKGKDVLFRAETNTRFIHIFTKLHKYSNTQRAFRYTENDFSPLILAY